MTAWHEDRFKVSFLARIAVQDDGCWLWTGGGAKEKYGRFYAGDTTEQWAHRNAWRLHHGQDIPPGVQIHHRCETPKCVNPLHLEALTREEHQLRHPATTDRPHGLAKAWVEKCRCEVCAPAVRAYRRQYVDRARAEAAAGERPIPHGTTYAYNNLACRCEECREVKKLEQRTTGNRTGMSLEEWREASKAKHGTTSMYTAHKCRCDECRENWNAYWRAHRAAKRAQQVAS